MDAEVRVMNIVYR